MIYERSAIASHPLVGDCPLADAIGTGREESPETPASPVTGQVYYDTTLNQFGCYQNAAWVYLIAAGNVSKSANASATNVLQVSGGADKTIADFTSVGGIPSRQRLSSEERKHLLSDKDSYIDYLET